MSEETIFLQNIKDATDNVNSANSSCKLFWTGVPVMSSLLRKMKVHTIRLGSESTFFMWWCASLVEVYLLEAEIFEAGQKVFAISGVSKTKLHSCGGPKRDDY